MALLLPEEEEDHWTELLQLIRGDQVIPVVGSELLQIGEAPVDFLYARLTRDLAAELRMPEPPPGSLNEVACRYLESRRGGSLSPLYSGLRKLLETRNYPIPEPLRKLAAIAPLRLFLSTTFDSSLEKAVDSVRCGGRPVTRAIPFSIEYGGDLPEPLENEQGVIDPPIVFHLFGLPFPFNKYAVTDEDILEYIHSLQSSKHAPEKLFNVVADKHLLIIGSSFTDWLARFFIRSAKRERIWMAKGREDFLADATPMREQSFALFLHHYGAGMKVFAMPPVAFVDELYRRWIAEQPPAPSTAPAAPTAPGPADTDEPAELRKMKPGSIFLCYASENSGIADSICRQLEAKKLDVWLDHRKLQSGQKWEGVIRRNIDAASMVVVLLSRASLDRGYRFFRIEWKLALKRAEGKPDDPPFMLLYSIDGTRIDNDPDLFPDGFTDLHYELAPEGVLSSSQLDQIVEWFMTHETLREIPK
jgi:hypothetical protein